MIGKLDKRIKILQKSVVRDSIGGESIVYTELKSTWAMMEKTITGNDQNLDMSGRQTAVNEIDFVLRYFVGLSEDMIIEHNGLLGVQYYKIKSVNEEGDQRRKGYIRLTCQKFDLEK